MIDKKSVLTACSRVHGYMLYRKFLDNTQHWPADRQNDYTHRQLRATLVTAYEGTEYYKAAFRKAGVDPLTDFRGPNNLTALPVLTKQEVRDNHDALLDRRHLAGSIVAHTSGTTGEPLHMRLSERFLAFDTACIFRHWSWAGYRFRAPMAAIRSYVPETDNDPLWRYNRAQNTLYFSAYHLTPKNCSQYIDALLRFQPEFIKAYPSSAAVLAEYAYSVRERFTRLRGVFVSSETLTPSERATIEKTFGPILFNWYGMTEPAIVLTECERHEGMHINWEYGHVELVRADDLPENEFRLVTTGFHNPVMPFIRYDTGDVVRVPSGGLRTCSCGRNLPLVETVVGRKDECIITPDGRRIPSINFYTVFRKHQEIIRFQIVQYGIADVVVKLCLAPGTTDRDAVSEGLRRELRARFGPDIRLAFDFTDRFLTNWDGKSLPIVRRTASRGVDEKDEYQISSQTAWQMRRNGVSVYKLDWNEAEGAPLDDVRRALHELVDTDEALSWYPEAGSPDLSRKLAEFTGAAPQNIILTNGSDCAMELLATCFIVPGDRVLIVTPTYDNFRAVSEARGATVEQFRHASEAPFPAEALAERIRTGCPRIVYLCNPNNPIGYSVPQRDLIRLLAVCESRSAILIVDEAYYDFSGVTVADIVSTCRYGVVLRTFSKAFGFAGLRLGYLVASDQLAAVLHRANNPKSVNTFAKTAAAVALSKRDFVLDYVQQVNASKQRLYALFDECGVRYYRSDGNFILFQYELPSELIEFLQQRHIVVRDRTKFFGGVGHVRVTVGRRKSTDAVIAAFRAYFSGTVQSIAAQARPL